MAKFDLLTALEMMKGVSDPKKALSTVTDMLSKFHEMGRSVASYASKSDERGLEITQAAATVKIAQMTNTPNEANRMLVIALTTLYCLGYADAEKAAAEKLANS